MWHDLLNPATEMAGQELWANTKTGRNRGVGGKGHNYDDHRGNHLAEFEKRFAQDIVQQIDTLIANLKIKSLVLVAEPQILGMLRDCLHSSNGRSVTISDLAKDLCWMKPRQLHDYLSQKGILPERQVALAATRARKG
jgi:protein required for attachment to host cells